MSDNAYLRGYELGHEYGALAVSSSNDFQHCVERVEDWAAAFAKTPLGQQQAFTEEEWHLWAQGVFDGTEAEYTRVYGKMGGLW